MSINQFRDDIFLDFLKALEEKQEEIEQWAQERFEKLGYCYFSFEKDPMDKTLKFKSECIECSPFYVRPIALTFSEYTIDVETNPVTKMPICAYISPCY